MKANSNFLFLFDRLKGQKSFDKKQIFQGSSGSNKKTKIRGRGACFSTKCHDRFLILFLWFLNNYKRLSSDFFILFSWLYGRSVVKISAHKWLPFVRKQYFTRKMSRQIFLYQNVTTDCNDIYLKKLKLVLSFLSLYGSCRI